MCYIPFYCTPNPKTPEEILKHLQVAILSPDDFAVLMTEIEAGYIILDFKVQHTNSKWKDLVVINVEHIKTKTKGELSFATHKPKEYSFSINIVKDHNGLPCWEAILTRGEKTMEATDPECYQAIIKTGFCSNRRSAAYVAKRCGLDFTIPD